MKFKNFTFAMLAIALLGLGGCAEFKVRQALSPDGKMMMYEGKSYDPMGIDSKSLIFADQTGQQQTVVSTAPTSPAPTAPWQPQASTVPVIGTVNGYSVGKTPQVNLPAFQPQSNTQAPNQVQVEQQQVATPASNGIKVIVTNNAASDGWAKPVPVALINAAGFAGGSCLGKTRINITGGNSSATGGGGGAASAASSSSSASSAAADANLNSGVGP